MLQLLQKSIEPMAEFVCERVIRLERRVDHVAPLSNENAVSMQAHDDLRDSEIKAPVALPKESHFVCERMTHITLLFTFFVCVAFCVGRVCKLRYQYAITSGIFQGCFSIVCLL